MLRWMLALVSASFVTSCQPQERDQVQDGNASAAEASVPAEDVAGRENRIAENASAARKLYKEVKGLNDACVDAGGGVSGSPDCEAAAAKEKQLEKLGYCIDYPNGGRLARCDEVKWRP